MKVRIQADIFVENLTEAEETVLQDLMIRSLTVDGNPSFVKIHDCGHDEGKACGTVRSL